MTTSPRAPAGATRRVVHIWGTAISLDFRDAIAPLLVDDLVRWFERVDDVFSTWRDDSEISRLGRHELSLREASEDLREVLALCERIRGESGGAFDATFGADTRVAPRPGFGPVDASGLVKGWALERAASRLREAGVANFSINAGGDVITRGRPAPGHLWRIGIQHPIERLAVASVVAGTDLAVATSGRYERGDHVIDPRTGAPATDLLAVTVVAPDLGVADGCATAAMVLGAGGMDWLAGRPDTEALAITNEGTVILTDGFDRLRAAAPAGVPGDGGDAGTVVGGPAEGPGRR